MINQQNVHNQKHTFAFYYEFEEAPATGTLLALSKKHELYHRLTQVVRATPETAIELFDGTFKATAKITEISKNAVCAVVENITAIEQRQPHVLLLLPILKREALEEAVRNAIETGVTSLQLYTPERSHRAFGGEKEHARLIACARASAEQAKSYEKIQISFPATLQLTLKQSNVKTIIVFHQSGNTSSELLKIAKTPHLSSALVVVGPEADFSLNEMSMLRQSEAHFYKLTPTILRTPQAVAVGCGLLKTVFQP